MGKRAVSNVANPSNGAYAQFLDNMGDQPVSDLARSVEVGTTGAQNGTREAALDILGQEMARTGNARAAIHLLPYSGQNLIRLMRELPCVVLCRRSIKLSASPG